MGAPEKKVEDYLVKQITKLGGIAYKFVSPARRSVPDRLCVLPGFIIFVECKTEKGVLSKGQYLERKRLTNLGASTAVVHSKEEIDALMLTIKSHLPTEE